MPNVTLPTLHGDQVRAFRTFERLNAKRCLIRCGRRWGKTKYGITIAGDGAVKRREVGWFAPDYKRVTETYSELVEIVKPVKERSSRTEGIIGTTTGGRIDFWTLDDESAGRSRRYHEVIIDEGAFTKDNMIGTDENPGIYDKAILPTTLDFQGRVTVLSNTNGNDPSNFLYAISPAGGDRAGKYGFVEHHAPSWSNPTVPLRQPDESFKEWLTRRDGVFRTLKKNNHPLVFLQEYAAEFVDWSGVAFFTPDKLLVGGHGLDLPRHCDAVFAVVDSATKTGRDNDGTGVVYYALNRSNVAHPLTILDYDLVQIEGDLLITWLPTVLSNLEDLASRCGARNGSLGAFIEDKDSGQILLQAAARKGLLATPIPGTLTALGKDERAISSSGFVYQELIKFTQLAYDKVVAYKGATRNHLWAQIVGFRVGDKDAAKRADDLLDCFTYGVLVGLGNPDGV